MSQGVVVRISINRWRGTAPIKMEDLGLKVTNESSKSFMDKYIRLGKEILMPHEVESQLSSIESLARKVLRDYSFQTVWGNFVPFSAFDEWELENEKVKQRFMGISAYIGQEYNNIINTIRENYKVMAHDVWSRLYPGQGSATSAFVEKFCDDIIAKVPSRQAIISSFNYETIFFSIPMPSVLENNLLEADKIKEEREQLKFKSQIEKEAKEKIAKKYLERKQELIDNFLDSTILKIRKDVEDLCRSVLLSMNRNGKKYDINKSKKEKIQRFIKRINLLNFYDDVQISNLLKELDSEVDKFKGERDNDHIEGLLNEIIKECDKDLSAKDFNPSISILEI